MRIPDGYTARRRSPEFTDDTIPPTLRSAHETTHDTWAVLHVLEGRLRYRTVDPPSEAIIEPGCPGIIAPNFKHYVEPLGPVRFFLEFHYPPDQHPDG